MEQEEKQVQRIENIVLKERQNVVTKQAKQAKQRVIISFSVPFFELNKLKNVIKKLGEISNIFDQIYLNIPYDFTQNGEESETFHDENQKTIALPQWLGDSSIESFKLKLRANRCPNWGPLTKVFGVLPLEKEDDTILIFITPDNEIDQEEITNLISRIKLSKSTSYSYYGYRDVNNLDIVALSTLGSGLICKRSFFNNTINQLKQVSLPDLSEFPDLLLSAYLMNNHISLELITAQKDLEKRRIQELSLDKYSETLKKYDFLNYKVLTLKCGFTSTVVTSTVVTSTMEGKNNMIENVTQINDPTIGKIVQTEQGNAKFHLNKNYLSKMLQFEEQRIKQKTNLEIRHKIISGIKIHYKDVDANVIKESKVAVIVEPRNDPLLPLLIRNFMEVLGEDWTFQIFHGLNNEVRLKKAFGFNRLILEKNKNWKVMFNKMEVENLSRDEYSRLLLEKDFYELCRGENILIYQLDSCLNPNSQFKIDRFLEYDYIGAPWIHGQRSLVNGRDRIFIGNGGLSLRKRSTMVEVCEILQSGYRHLLNKNEDLVISSLLHSQHFKDKVNLPDPYLARKFSVELIYEPRSLGVHKAWKYLSRDDLDKLMKEVPQVNEFFVGKYFSL